MTYFQGKDVKVYITTEAHEDAVGVPLLIGICCTAGTYAACLYNAANLVIPMRPEDAWEAAGVVQATEITGVTGIDLGAERSFEDIDLFGQQQQEHIPYNKKYTCKITLKADDKINSVATATWGKLFDAASHGLRINNAGTNYTVNDGLIPLNETYSTKGDDPENAYIGGFRIYVKVGVGGTSPLWYVFYNSILKQKITLDIKTHSEELSFEGNKYSVDYATAPTVSANSTL